MSVGRGRGVPLFSGAVSHPARGQTLVLLVSLLAVLMLSAWWVYETGRTHLEKRRLINAVDTAALNAAVWQSRALNFDAYTTRAIIANEALIAQSVSIRSWSQYVDVLLPTVATSLSWVPYVQTVAQLLQRSWNILDRVLDPSLRTFEGVASLVDHDLAAAQRLVHLSVVAVVPDVVRASLQAADPAFSLTRGGESVLSRWSLDWVHFASFYGGAWRWRQQEVIERSMDGFSARRSHRWRPALGTDLLRLEKRGGTELIQFETWRGLDTLSLHTRRYGLWGSIRERQPIAWGAAEAGRRAARRGDHDSAYRINPRAAALAERAMRSHRAYLGLPSVFDLSASQRESFSPPVVVVRAQLGTGDSAPQAQAAATSWFIRPDARADGRAELPSLFSPYWTPRWIATPALDRWMLMAQDRDPAWLAAFER